jgi:dipicolinate synthase subunit B
MLLEGIRIGVALTGSFCTFTKIIPEIEEMIGSTSAPSEIISCRRLYWLDNSYNFKV